MIEFLQSLFLTLKVAIFEWFPLFSEMENAAWGPFAVIKTILGVITTGFVIVKLLDRYGIETWGGNPKPPKKKDQETKSRE